MKKLFAVLLVALAVAGCVTKPAKVVPDQTTTGTGD